MRSFTFYVRLISIRNISKKSYKLEMESENFWNEQKNDDNNDGETHNRCECTRLNEEEPHHIGVWYSH